MELKDLLGDSYKEDMTVAEINTLISKLKLADLSKGEYVSVGKYSDEQQKATNYKAELDAMKKANMTAEEKNRADYEELKALLEAEKSKSAMYELEKSILSNGYSKEECARIMVNPSDASVYSAIQRERIELAVAQANAKSVKDTTVIPQASDLAKSKKITDYSMTELNRLQTENPSFYNEIMNKK